MTLEDFIKSIDWDSKDSSYFHKKFKESCWQEMKECSWGSYGHHINAEDWYSHPLHKVYGKDKDGKWQPSYANHPKKILQRLRYVKRGNTIHTENPDKVKV